MPTLLQYLKKAPNLTQATIAYFTYICVCKTMDHILVSQIMKYLEHQTSCQKASLDSDPSSESQLFITINDMAKHMDNNYQVDTAILDYSKAFDKVCPWVHQTALEKLT